MTEIYLIRHAQAEGNLYRIMQGHWDGEVTDLGLKQIEALSHRFEDVHIDAVYSSDLSRTIMTASAVTGPHHLPLTTVPALREIHLGPWETRFFANLFYDEPEAANHFVNDPEKWSVEGAETYGQVQERSYAALVEIARQHEGQTVVVVSHGVTCRCLLAKICGIGLSETKKLPIGGNTAVSKLIWQDGRFTAEYINDSSHLAALPAVPWSAVPDFRHEILDPAVEREYYTACYADAWAAAHGGHTGFSAEPYLTAAMEHHRRYPGAVLKICDQDRPAGLVDLDTARGAHAGYGWISLLYLKPEYRYRGGGVQLLARAISTYAALGRSALRLHVAEDNTAAAAFYRRWGFELLSAENTGGSRLLLMEKKLGRNWREC